MAIVLDGVESFVGKCIAEYEVNRYDDSDFFMVVWNDKTDAPERIMFASTRFSGGLGSYVDATPEIKAKYAEWQVRRDRVREIKTRWAERKQAINDAAAFGLASRRQVAELKKAVPRGYDFDRVRKLFTSKLRSGFRLSLKAQILDWLTASVRKYDSPLSRKQWDYL
jgi:hypothetical protein